MTAPESGPDTGRFTPAFVPSDLATALAPPDGTIGWIGIDDPDPGQIDALLDAAGIHTVDRRLLGGSPRRGSFHVLEDQGILVTVPTAVSDADDASSLQVVVGREALLVVTRNGAADGVVALRGRTEAHLTRKGSVLTPALGLETVLIPVFAGAESVLDGLEDDLELLAQRLFPEITDADVAALSAIAERLLVVERAMLPLARGIRIASVRTHLHGEEDSTRMEARVALAAVNLEERLSWLAGRIDWITDTIFALSWREANSLAGRQNLIAQRISAYAALLAIPAGVFSLYGVNFVHLPPLLRSDYGYPVLLATTAMLMAALAWHLRRRGWL